MTLRMIYLLPMILGRTFDAKTNRVGLDIFPQEALQNAKVIAETSFGSSYKTISSSSDAKEVLGIKGGLSLNIKGNLISLQGAGSYLKETLNKGDAVETMFKVSFRTYSRSLPPSIKPLAHWRTMGAEYLGTHYVQSIIYGGDLIATVAFRAVKSEYLRDIKGAVKASLKSGNALQLVADGKLEMLEEKLKGLASVEVNYFATVPLEGVPNSIQGLSDLVRNFESHVKKVNNGWGVPAEVELAELSVFDTKFEYLKNSLLESELAFFEESFDDLLQTKSKLKEWVSSIATTLSDELEAEIDDFRQKVSETLRVFYEVISNLDLSQGPEQLSEGTIIYKKNSKSDVPGKFLKEFNKLKKKVGPQSEESPERGTSVYTLYGKSECRNGTTTVYSGYLAASPNNAKGGGTNYLCLPRIPQGFEVGDVEKLGKTSYLVGVKFGILQDTNLPNDQSLYANGVVCAVCLVPERTTLITFTGTGSCPDDNTWTAEYAGYLMSSARNRAQTVCLDGSPEVHNENEATSTDHSLNVVRIRTEDGDDMVQCAVCSK